MWFACTGAGSSSKAYRSEQLLQLCTQAAQEEDIPTGQGRFQQALALAQKYNSPTWDLQFQYLHSLMLHWQHASSVIVPLVKDLFPALMQQPYKTVQRSLVQTWPELQGQRQLHVAFALKLLEKCFQWVQTGDGPGAEPVLLELQSSMDRLALLQVCLHCLLLPDIPWLGACCITCDMYTHPAMVFAEQTISSLQKEAGKHTLNPHQHRAKAMQVSSKSAVLDATLA